MANLSIYCHQYKNGTNDANSDDNDDDMLFSDDEVAVDMKNDPFFKDAYGPEFAKPNKSANNNKSNNKKKGIYIDILTHASIHMYAHI